MTLNSIDKELLYAWWYLFYRMVMSYDKDFTGLVISLNFLLHKPMESFCVL